jgi:hypothetical protein
MFDSDNKSNSKEYIFILSRFTTSVESLRAGFMPSKIALVIRVKHMKRKVVCGVRGSPRKLDGKLISIHPFLPLKVN